MALLPIIEHLNIIEKILFRLIARLIVLAINPFGLDAAKETFHHRVVPAIALAAHAANDLQLVQRLLVNIRGILHAPDRCDATGRALANLMCWKLVCTITSRNYRN